MKNLSVTFSALIKQRGVRCMWKLSTALTVLLAVILISCNINPGMDDVTKTKEYALPDGFPEIKRPLPSFSIVSLDRIDLYLDKGNSTDGKFIVEIRNSDGSVTLGTSVVAASSLIASAWNTFNFSPALNLTPGNKYRIYVLRSGVHNYPAGNYIFWRTSSGGVDAYPNGVNDVYPSWTLDYAFKTYSSGIVDQQQTLTTYGFAVGNTDYHWQEFVPDFPKVKLTYVDLNLDAGSATTGTLTVQIRNEDGSAVLSQSIITANSLLPGSNWRKFKLGTTLNLNQKYRIYVIRSDTHNYPLHNYIFWRTSSGGVDAYPDGVNDVYPSWTLDFAFRTYSSISGLDQHQDLTTYGFAIGNTDFHWQEFIPRNP